MEGLADIADGDRGEILVPPFTRGIIASPVFTPRRPPSPPRVSPQLLLPRV